MLIFTHRTDLVEVREPHVTLARRGLRADSAEAVLAIHRAPSGCLLDMCVTPVGRTARTARGRLKALIGDLRAQLERDGYVRRLVDPTLQDPWGLDLDPPAAVASKVPAERWSGAATHVRTSHRRP